MPLNVNQKWVDVLNSPDYVSGDPTVRQRKADEWLTKLRTDNVNNPDFNEAVYEDIKKKVMLKERPSNQYGMTQTVPTTVPGEMPFDINTGLQATPENMKMFENITPTTTPSPPPPGAKEDIQRLQDQKWVDILKSDYYNQANDLGKIAIGERWLNLNKPFYDVNPVVWSDIERKVRGSLPINGKKSPTITEQPNAMAKVEKQINDEGMAIAAHTLDLASGVPQPLISSELNKQKQYTQEQINQMNREAYGKTYAPFMATPEEIATAGLAPNETEKALNISKPIVRSLDEVQALQDPGFVGSMLNPAEWVAMGGAGSIIAKRFGKPILATTLDYAFNGLPAIIKGGKGFIRGVIGGYKGLEGLAKKSSSNPAQVEDMLESVFLEGWDKATFERLVKQQGGRVGESYIDQAPKHIRDTTNALKKYGKDMGMTEDEIWAMIRTGDIPPTQPMTYSEFKPFLKPPEPTPPPSQQKLPGLGGAIPGPKQLTLQLGETAEEAAKRAAFEAVPEPIPQPGKIMTPPPKEPPMASGLIPGEEPVPDVGRLNPRIDLSQPSYMTAAKEWLMRLENPIRMFERLGGNLKQIIYDPIDQADQLGIREMHDRFRPIIKSWAKNPNIDTEKLAVYMISRQKDGPETLAETAKLTGKKWKGMANAAKNWEKKIQSMTADELEAVSTMDRIYEEMYHRINVARIKAGLKPIGKVDNYFTFYRQMDFMDQMGLNIVDAVDYQGDVEKMFGHMNSTFFAEAKSRLGSKHIPVEIDAFRTFDRYLGHALNHINLTPEIAKGQKIIRQIKGTHPEAHEHIQQWLNYVAGKGEHNMSASTRKALLSTNRRVATSLLAYNLRVATGQVAALTNTFASTKPRHMSWGIGQFLNDAFQGALGKQTTHRKMVLQNSNLIGRLYDQASEELWNVANGKITGKMVRAGMYPMKFMDAVAAEITWNSFYNHGRKTLGLAGKELIQFANDGVVRTQASGRRMHTAPIQRSDWGRFLSVLQTFRINDWGFVTRDVLGMGPNAKFNKENLSRVMKWIIGSEMVTSFFEDILHTDSPAPHPVRAVMQELNKKDPSFFDAVTAGGREMMETIPFIGTATRFRDSIFNPTIGAAVKIAESLVPVGKPERDLKTAGYEAMKLTGIPTSPIRYAEKAGQYASGKIKDIRNVFYSTPTDRLKAEKKKGQKKKMAPISSSGEMQPIGKPKTKGKKKLRLTPLE